VSLLQASIKKNLMILKNSNNTVDTQLSRDPQYRKELSIAFFNATNSAIALTVSLKDETMNLDKMLEVVSGIREHFLEQYKTYRVETLDVPTDTKVAPGLAKAREKYENKT